MAKKTLPQSFKEILAPGKPKKLLALDGGGILGVLSLGFLAKIEATLRVNLKQDNDFVLADYFDYIAGTSTGAIIAAGLSMGMSVKRLLGFYVDHGEEMFDKEWIIYQKTYNKYQGQKLRLLLQDTFGLGTTLQSLKDRADRHEDPKGLKTLLMAVMRNATTDSPWPVSNNPGAIYNDTKRDDCNLLMPIWKLVRASTAAPTYFPAEDVTLGRNNFVFVDGGVTSFNNPALQLFLMATVDRYRLCWPTGVDKMLLVSIGTGASPDADPRLTSGQMNIYYNATHIPPALMAAANAQQDFLCRVLGKCVHGPVIDREVGDMIGSAGLGPGAPKHFTYVRYNVDLTQDGLDALGLGAIRASDVQAIDSVAHINDLKRIGVEASKSVSWNHFQSFPL
jgi:patatin-like phospholipase/acyl hydrolase